MRLPRTALFVCAAAALIMSCSGDGEKSPEGEARGTAGSAEEEILSSSSEMINFGVYFDREGKERTIRLKDDQKQFKAYVILRFPEGMEVCAGQWKLLLPEGIELVNSVAIQKANLSLGNLTEMGVAERYGEPLTGGEVLIRELNFIASGDPENARIQIVKGGPDDFLGIATCETDYPKKAASSFVGVVNPLE